MLAGALGSNARSKPGRSGVSLAGGVGVAKHAVCSALPLASLSNFTGITLISPNIRNADRA